MNDLDQKILSLKSQGKSLREIGSDLHLSYEGVRKRLRNLVRESQMSTPTENKRLTALVIENEGLSTRSNARKSRTCEVVNQMSTPIPPSSNPADAVNQSQTASEKRTGGKKEATLAVSPEIDDSITAIKEFLESHGIEVYPMQCEPEAYQIKHDGQVIRFYVHRDKEIN